MSFNGIFLALLLLFQFTSCDFTEHRREILDQNGAYELKWSIDYENKLVRFNATVKSKGYVGFGISPAGGMGDADIVIGGVHPNGTNYFKDYHGVGPRSPVEDEEQNWVLEEAVEVNDSTNLIFSRTFDTCDDQDVILSNDTTNFIWSFGSDDNIMYHGTTNRGSLTVQPLDPDVPPADLTLYDTYEIKHTMLMPPEDTTYWCTFHKSPVFTAKHHIVAFEPLLNSPEAIAHTHHYNIFRCRAPEGSNYVDFFEPYIGQPGGLCYVPNPVIPSEHCQTMFYTWAVGGHMLILPKNTGYPIGETGNEVDYYMFEIHYNNPTLLDNVTFETGAIIYYTNETRELDAGLMVVAHHTSISLTVPPKSSGYKTVGHCDSACTKEFLPEDGINVFAILLHAHLSGRKMKFRQFRDGVELPWAANDESYDFEFQQTRPLSKELKILPSDHLTMECFYNTNWRNGTTVGGLSSSDEMCQSTFWYWPRAELRDCRSEYPIEDVFKKFGIISANRSTMYEDAIITEPEEFKNMKYTEVLDTRIEWSDALRQELQEDSVNSKHKGVCWTDTESKIIPFTSYPQISNEYRPTRDCLGDEDQTSSTTTEKADNSAATRPNNIQGLLLLTILFCLVFFKDY